MWVARASSPPTAASPAATQNSHHMGPKIRARPPIRNATMMRDTATQDTGRPWCDTVAGPPVLTWLSWPLSAETPATAPEPSWSAIPLLLSGACPLGARPLAAAASVKPYCGGASLAVRAGPVSAARAGRICERASGAKSRLRWLTRLRLLGGRQAGKHYRTAARCQTGGPRQTGLDRPPPDDPRGARREVPTIIDKVLRVGEAGQMRRLKRIADQVNSIEEHFTPLSDAELRGMTDQFRERLGEGDTLDELLPEAFAAVREAARRTLGQRHFDVQIMGGAALHGGNIAEMRT